MKTIDIDLIRQEWGLTQAERDDAYREALSALPLAALRAESGLTQLDMAKRLRKTQAAVSKFEGRGDFLVSTLQRYVDAIGGTLDIAIRTADKCYQLIKSEDAGSPVFRLGVKDHSGASVWERVQIQISHQRSTELWTKRNICAEEVDMLSTYSVSANDFFEMSDQLALAEAAA